MADRQLRICSTSLATKEIQIKTTLRYNLTPVRMAKSKTPMIAYSIEDVSKGNTHPLPMGMQTCTITLEISMAVSQKIGNQPTSGSNYTTLVYILKRCSIKLQRYMFNYVHSSIISNSQNLETT